MPVEWFKLYFIVTYHEGKYIITREQPGDALDQHYTYFIVTYHEGKYIIPREQPGDALDQH